MVGENSTVSVSSKTEIINICGMWEVLRITDINKEIVSYPWIKDRFKFNFLSEMIFLCLRDGKTIHGSWELIEKTHETQKQFSIVLNETYEFTIISCDEDEMLLTDHTNNYLLVRRL